MNITLASLGLAHRLSETPTLPSQEPELPRLPLEVWPWNGHAWRACRCAECTTRRKWENSR